MSVSTQAFLALKPGDIVELPMDQTREIDHGPSASAKPWDIVATTKTAWLDHLSGKPTFFVDPRDVISIRPAHD
jgi:hypothetical protein